MKKFSIPSLLLLLFLLSCGQAENINYNDKIVNLYDEYVGKNTLFERQIIYEEDPKKVYALINEFDDYTDSCMTIMNETKAPKEAEEFHHATLSVYQSIKNDYIPAIKKMVDASDNEEAYNQAVDDYNEVLNKIENLENKARQKQEEYAQKVNMQIR